MGWARFDDCYTDHPKVVAAGNDAELLDVRAILYCSRYETDGHLPAGSIALLGRGMTAKKAQAAARTLVDVGRWTVAEGGWDIVDFLEYNPSHESKEQDRAAARDRMARLRNGRGSKSVRPNQPDARAGSSQELRSTPSRPVPEENHSSSRTVSTTPVDNPPTREESSRSNKPCSSASPTAVPPARVPAPGVPAKYRAKVLQDLPDEVDLPRLRRIIASHPGAPIEMFADAAQNNPTPYLKNYRAEPAEATPA